MTTHTLAFESLLDPSNEVRKAAEAAFHALRESEPALVCTQLVAGLAHGPQVRQLCAVLLRRYLPAMGPQISREMWEAVKAGLLQALAAEPDAAQRRKLCDAVGRLGAEFYVDGNWPELAQFISGACTAGEPAAHEAAITIVAHMAPALVEPDAWAQHGGPLTGMLVAALDNFAQPAVQGAALSALATLLRNAAEASEANKGKDEVRKAKAVVASMAHVLGKMLGVLEGAVNAGEAGRMLGVVQDISDVAGAAPRLFKMLLPQVLEGMAALATSPLAADVRVACAELLMTLAEGAPKMVAKLPQYGGRVLSVLVPMMVNLEGLQLTSYTATSLTASLTTYCPCYRSTSTPTPPTGRRPSPTTGSTPTTRRTRPTASRRTPRRGSTGCARRWTARRSSSCCCPNCRGCLGRRRRGSSATPRSSRSPRSPSTAGRSSSPICPR
jgi:hypothetical protein